VFPHISPWKEVGWTKSHIFVKRPNVARPDPTFLATGTGGPILARRAELIIVDDPTDQDIAYSEVQRNSQKQWFKQTLLTRLVEGGRCIVILTRWHEDDLAAELMKPEMGFFICHVPAVDANGGSYWPERWSLPRLEQKRDELGGGIFRCMFLGDPFDIKGQIWRSEWFRYYSAEPELKYKVQAWDTAIGTAKEADFSVCATLGIDAQNRIYLLDIFRAQLESPELLQQIIAQYAKHRPRVVGVEDKLLGAIALQMLQRQILIPFKGLKAREGKLLRARSVTPFFEMGRIFFKAQAGWLDETEHELLTFPVGKHDDIPDAITYGIKLLAETTSRLVLTRRQHSGMSGLRRRRF